MALKDSSHLTTHEQQLQAYRAYETLLQELPGPLADPEHLLQVASQLLYLPNTFPASYLQIYDPILPMCLKIARTLEFLDLPKLLGSEAPQISLDCLQESIIGYGFLTTAQYIADLFFAVGDIQGVQTAKFRPWRVTEIRTIGLEGCSLPSMRINTLLPRELDACR